MNNDKNKQKSQDVDLSLTFLFPMYALAIFQLKKEILYHEVILS